MRGSFRTFTQVYNVSVSEPMCIGCLGCTQQLEVLALDNKLISLDAQHILAAYSLIVCLIFLIFLIFNSIIIITNSYSNSFLYTHLILFQLYFVRL